MSDLAMLLAAAIALGFWLPIDAAEQALAGQVAAMDRAAIDTTCTERPE